MDVCACVCDYILDIKLFLFLAKSLIKGSEIMLNMKHNVIRRNKIILFWIFLIMKQKIDHSFLLPSNWREEEKY